MADVIKGIEIIDETSVLEEFEDAIRSKGLSVYQVGADKTVYGIGDTEKERESLNEAVESNAFILNLDFARAKLLYVNRETGQIRESKNLMEQFVSEIEDIDDATEGVPVSLLPELIDYIGENPELTEDDMTAVFNAVKSDEHTETVSDEGETEESSSALNDFEDEFEDDFFDDVEEAEETKEEQLETEQEEDPKEFEDDESESFSEDEEPAEEAQEDTENKDYLMEKAISLFDSQNPLSLPQFDELTHKELQKQVLDSQFTVSKARDKGINEIYNRLTKHKEESLETIKANVIAGAREKHEDVLNRIERNYNHDVEKLLNESNAEYEKDRENFIQAQIPIIRKQYDAKHYPEYESVLTTEIEQLRKQSDKEMNEERERFRAYVDNVLNDSQERAMSAVRVDDIIEEYNKVAEEQKELLLLEAKNMKKEIGATLSEIVKERDDLKEEINASQEELERQKQGEQERIDSGVSEAMQRKEQKLKKENKAKLDKAYAKEQELIKQIEKLETDLASEQEQKDNMRREYIEPAQEVAATSGEATEGNHPAYLHEAESPKFRKIKFYVGCGVSAVFLLLFSAGVFTLIDIKDEMAKGNYYSQSSYLAQLESNERYDKAAREMKKFGYGKDSIAEMYLENGHYILALETDKGVLPEVYTFAEKTAEDQEAHQGILENIKENIELNAEYVNGIDARIAIINDDAEAVNDLTLEKEEKVDSGSAKEAVRYFIDKKDYDAADKLLKVYPDAELSDELEEARTADVKEEIAGLKDEIESLDKEIEDNENKGEELEEELDKAKSKDKKKKKKDIKKNNEAKEGLEKDLEEKQNKLEELEKEL